MGWQQCLYFRPDPQGQGSLRPGLLITDRGVSFGRPLARALAWRCFFMDFFPIGYWYCALAGLVYVGVYLPRAMPWANVLRHFMAVLFEPLFLDGALEVEGHGDGVEVGFDFGG